MSMYLYKSLPLRSGDRQVSCTAHSIQDRSILERRPKTGSVVLAGLVMAICSELGRPGCVFNAVYLGVSSVVLNPVQC